MRAEYIYSHEYQSETNNSEISNEALANAFPWPNTNEDKNNSEEKVFEQRLYYRESNTILNEDKSSELSSIKEHKETKESTNNQISPIISEKVPKTKLFQLFVIKDTLKKEEDKKILGKKTGRKPKNESKKPNDKQLSRKYDMDDIMIKNQVSYTNYCTDSTNCLLKKFQIKERFLPIDHKIKKLATFDNFYALKEKTIGDIIKLKRSDKYRKNDPNHNEILYEKIIKDFPVIKNFFGEKYFSFFQKYYYKGEKNISLKEYGCNEILTLSNEVISHKDKINSFKEPKYAETYENYVRDLYFNNKINFHATK